MGRPKADPTSTPAPPPPPTALEPRPRWRQRDGLLAAIVFVAAFAVFANSLPNGFVYDDTYVIRDNPRLNSPWNLRVFFGTSYLGDVSPNDRHYRPLTHVSFAIDRAVFGPGPFGVHLMNVLANALVGALVYAFLFSLLERRAMSFAAALLFAIHPVHTEVVANGVGRSELYSAVLMLGAALLHVRSIRDREATPAAPAWPWLAGAVVLYWVALFVKESAVVLPGLLFLAEWLVLRRGSLAAMVPRLPRYLVYALPLVVFLVIRGRVVGPSLPAVQEVMAYATTTQRLLYASETLLAYLGQLVIPWRLCAEYSDYTNPVDRTIGEPLVLASLGTWVVLVILMAWLWRRRIMPPVFAAAWFSLALLPVSNLLFPIGTIRADRLLFVPSLGFTLAVAWVLAELARLRGARPIAVLALVAMAGLYSWRTIARNPVWRSTESLWTATVRVNPGSAVAWHYNGDIHRDAGRIDEAAICYQRAFELRDGAGFFYPEAHIRYAQILKGRGLHEAAEAQYRLVLSHEPTEPTAMLNLAVILLRRDESREESIELLQKLIRLEPDDFRSYANLAQAQVLAGRLDEARTAVDRAIELQPDTAGLWDMKSEIETRSGRTAEAERARVRFEQLQGAGRSP